MMQRPETIEANALHRKTGGRVSVQSLAAVLISNLLPNRPSARTVSRKHVELGIAERTTGMQHQK